MKTYIKIALGLVMAAFAVSCSDWTDTEPVDVDYETLKSKNPDLYEAYMESIRAYHATDHQVLIAKFDNKSGAPSGRADHINCLPDSVDYVILKNADSLSDAIVSEMAAHLQSSVFKLSKDLIDSIHEEGIVAYTS
jgi:hypothetical protein